MKHNRYMRVCAVACVCVRVCVRSYTCVWLCMCVCNNASCELKLILY